MAASFSWKFRPYVVPENVFNSPKISADAPPLEAAYHRTLKPWSRSSTGLVTPGYEPMAFVFQSTFPTALQYLLLIGFCAQAAPFIVRHIPANMFPRFIPTTMFTNRNWFLFAHKGT